MGYPVKQYRPTVAAQSRGGFQKPSTKPGQILGFPSEVSQKKKQRELRRERKGKPAHRVKKFEAGTNRARLMRSARRDLTMYAQRKALQRQALAGIKGGIRLRSMLLRAVASFVLTRLFDMGLNSLQQKPGALSKHPLWSVSAGGRWGTYPYCSDATGAHTVGSQPLHNAGPLVFGHPNGAFSWSEYDSVWKPSIGFWQFEVVGRGNRNAGPSGATYYSGIQSLPQPFDMAPNGLKNPWGLPYNPSWNRQPGRWPEGFPDPENLPMPSGLDDFSVPVYAPTPMPQPMPFALIPQRRPNPYRSPSEQTQWGPVRLPSPTTTPMPDPINDPIGWPDIIGYPPVVEPDFPPWTPPVSPPIVTTIEPGRPPRTRREFRRTRKPEKRVKERKIKSVQVAAKFMLGIINGITEMSDFIRALYKALPKKYQRRGILVKDQWKAVYQHWDEIDLIHGIRSVARDQIEDMIYGKAGRISGKAANKRGGLYDPAGRAMRKALDRKNSGFEDFDPVDYILDRIFGKDT